MVGISIPLWSSESQKPKLAGAKESLHSSELDRDAIRRTTMEKLDHLKAQIDTSSRKIDLLKTKAKQLLQSASEITREYEAGKSDLSMYLKTRRDVLAARSSLAAEKARSISLIAEFNSYIVGEDQ
jgi:outer membrane protein TolC